MKILLMMMVLQSLNLAVFAWLDRAAWVRILALRQQLAVYKRKSKKPLLRNRDRLFWSFLKGLERLGVRVDPREARDRDSMEEAKVLRVLADDVPGHVGQTANFQ